MSYWSAPFSPKLKSSAQPHRSKKTLLGLSIFSVLARQWPKSSSDFGAVCFSARSPAEWLRANLVLHPCSAGPSHAVRTAPSYRGLLTAGLRKEGTWRWLQTRLWLQTRQPQISIYYLCKFGYKTAGQESPKCLPERWCQARSSAARWRLCLLGSWPAGQAQALGTDRTRAASPTASQLKARSATNAKCRRSRGQGVGGGKLKENML